MLAWVSVDLMPVFKMDSFFTLQIWFIDFVWSHRIQLYKSKFFKVVSQPCEHVPHKQDDVKYAQFVKLENLAGVKKTKYFYVSNY